MKKVAHRYWENFPLKVGITCVIALLIICIYFPKGDEVYFINSLHSSTLDRALTNITLIGNGFALVPLVVISAFIRFRYTLMITLSAAICGLLVSLLKRVLFAEALRPVSVLNADLLHFVDGLDVHSLHSFPSGHTATAFVIAMLLSLLIRVQWITVLSFTIALLIGFSRVYLVQHFMGDVAAGAIIGIFSVSISYFLLFQRFSKTRWMDRCVQIKIGTAPQSGQPVGN